ncbi:MAG: sulfite exporter TauE/SafE family protein [Corynebacterium sp.]|uniref:sulfite exporter TauE/SafE family protein n=1 Tax=unclassified Corynebacterium TaxID=2624378 RepID=UPI002647E973|nr:sulfite exporter TauE/SafE family protein [Corynebacterium sp.]MDN5581737.1 sulfite exporter TauE/SafE family protein [Corynebacterium sp.]MDN5720232.1 sulfite exporter TauE/SafE family protein [Corynebacterium sp.]MDN6324148.1 sulfite exporter TauE/SafE family protein [Corynebacterium sp.]MDN6510311.1 sulfite exporter TauE/SafE family protein [Corynebacterium sp.]
MKLLLFAVAGLMAQLVDGALGMAFGVTATTMLILSGTAPAQASAAVHFAEVGTTLFSGLAHWRLNNVHWPTVVFLGIPGAVGAFAGATVLSGLSTESAEPVVSTLLLLLGAYVLIRSVLVPWKKPEGGDPGDTGETVPVSSGSRRSRLGLVTLGLGGGFLDASGGGGWGPVTTSSLMSVGRSEPRKIIGTVNTAEFLVAVSASLGFIIGLEQVHDSWQPVLGLLIGGLIGAPIAAWIVTVIKPDVLGGIVGAVLVALNGARVSASLGWAGGLLTAVTVTLCLVVIGRALLARRRRTAAAAAATAAAGPSGASEASGPVVIAVDAQR